MGKQIKFFTLVFALMLYLAVFWGCSNTNPVNDEGVYLSVDDSVEPNDNLDEPKDGGYEPPTNPGEYGKTADPSMVAHLYLDLSETIFDAYAEREVAKNGGVLKAAIDGKLFSLTILPHHLEDGAEFSMSVVKGTNEFDETLFIFNFTPDGEEFFYDPILTFEDEPNVGQNPAPHYTLFYYAAGTWVSYGTFDAQTDGIVRFYIPHFSTFAVLKQGGVDAPIDNLAF